MTNTNQIINALKLDPNLEVTVSYLHILDMCKDLSTIVEYEMPIESPVRANFADIYGLLKDSNGNVYKYTGDVDFDEYQEYGDKNFSIAFVPKERYNKELNRIVQLETQKVKYSNYRSYCYDKNIEFDCWDAYDSYFKDPAVDCSNLVDELNKNGLVCSLDSISNKKEFTDLSDENIPF